MLQQTDNIPTEKELLKIVTHTSSVVWQNELREPQVTDWLSNFDGQVFTQERERFFALWLLSHFTYYNQKEVTHLCKVLYRELLHKIITDSSTFSTNAEKVGEFFKKANIIPFEIVDDFLSKTNIVTTEELSGSSSFIAYFFRHVNDLPVSLFNFSIKNVASDIENIIFIDDVTLTEGIDGQMHRFLKKTIDKHPGKRFYLITLISSEASINDLKKAFNIEVITTIKLDSRDKCFSQDSDMFSQYPELLEDCKKFATYYGGKVPIVEPLGFRNGQYAFGFFYNTPDNTLPIFWAQINGWKPIIPRFHKNYGSIKSYFGHERFI